MSRSRQERSDRACSGLTAGADGGLIRLQVLPLLTAVALLSAPGCTAAKSGAVLVQAEQALREAEQARAPKNAPYEYALADAYRHKAREEWGNADYGAAEDLAEQALELARRAIEQAEFGLDEATGSDGLDDDVEDLD